MTPADAVPVNDLVSALLSGECTHERVTIALRLAVLQAEVDRLKASLQPVAEFPIGDRSLGWMPEFDRKMNRGAA